MKPKVSIMIPSTFGGFIYLAKLMPLLQIEAADNNAEIIVVDNNSKDGTLNYLGNYDCTVKINKINLGFAKAHNQAGRIAQGEYLLLLNNDTVIYPGWIKAMVEAFDSWRPNPGVAPEDKGIGIVGCLIYLMDGPKKIQHAGIMFTVEGLPYELGMDIPDYATAILLNDPRAHTVREVPAVTGACMMVKRECWDQLGGLNEEYINGWEDTDFCLRAREKGWKIWYTGKTFIKHKHFGSKHAGRFNNEAANRAKFGRDWVENGKAIEVLKGFLNG